LPEAQRLSQRTLLSASCDDASSGRMPGPWTLLHPEAKPSPKDIETIHFMTFYGERSQQLLDLLKKHAVAFKPIIRPPT